MRRYILPAAAAVILIGCAALLGFYLHGANIPVLNPQGPVALAERQVMLLTLTLCAIIVVPVFFLLFWFAWKYRADSPHAPTYHLPDWDHDNRVVEFLWWLVPTVIIAVLSVVAWQSSYALDPYKPLAVSGRTETIYVVALDWKWLFIYPAEGIASVNRVEMPAGVPVHFYLTADAPMNSFWIPALAGQIMVMPGMTTELNLMADKPGIYDGLSANISGEGFSGMAFTAESVSPADFDAWVRATKAASSSLDDASYAALAAPSSYAPVAQYGSVGQGLFDAILMKYMATSSMGGAMPMHMP